MGTFLWQNWGHVTKPLMTDDEFFDGNGKLDIESPKGQLLLQAHLYQTIYNLLGCTNHEPHD